MHTVAVRQHTSRLTKSPWAAANQTLAAVVCPDLEERAFLQGQVNMQGAAKGKLEFRDPKSGKTYKLGDKPATLKVSALIIPWSGSTPAHHQEISYVHLNLSQHLDAPSYPPQTLSFIPATTVFTSYDQQPWSWSKSNTGSASAPD